MDYADTVQMLQSYFIYGDLPANIEAGTYTLPEAQLDRFLLLIKIGYPTEQEEFDILNRTTGTKSAEVQPVISDE